MLPATDTPTTAYRQASERKDVAGMVACLAPDVVLVSPITDGFAFRGREQLRALLEDVMAVVDDVRYTTDVGDGSTRVLRLEARVGPQRLVEALLVELAPDGLITRMELFVRPLPGLTTLAAALGPRVARRRSPARALAVRAMIAPLAFATRHGEGLGARLARP
jgi:hypothetical protein